MGQGKQRAGSTRAGELVMLWKKLLRDILSNKGSYIACLVLVVIGLMVFTSFSIANKNLHLAKTTLYEEQNFADGFIELGSMPQGNVERLAQLDGIAQVNGRLVKEVRVNDPENDDSVYLLLVSYDLSEAERINGVSLPQGGEIRDGQSNAWLDMAFVDAHELERGDRIEIITNGTAREIIFDGVALSPEFVYLLRSETELYPNPSQYGVVFLPLQTMWSFFPEMQGRVNDLVFTLEEGASYDRVEEMLELELERYGLTTIYPREDQTSHFILIEEIEVIESLATFFPIMILSIASFIIYIVLKRLVEQQRTQIGILKAFGYTNREILLHYLSYSLVLAILGGVVGGLLGMWLANPLTSMLYDFFYLPEIYEGFSLTYLILGIILCLIVLGFAGYQGCKQVLNLKPAEAMRPPAPVSGKKNLLERLRFFSEMLTVQGKMAVRNLGRSRSRSFFMFFGIMISCAIIAFTWSLSTEAMPKFMFYQHEEVETYDARITLASPIAREAVLQELESYPEVTKAEPIAQVPITIFHQWREEQVVLLGLTQEGRLYNILDSNGNRVLPSQEGLILSERLAENLGLQVGSTVEIESPFMRNSKERVEVDVIEIIPQYIGMNAYMDLSRVEEILGQGAFATSVLVLMNNDREAVTALRDRYQESEVVTGVDGRHEMLRLASENWETYGGIMHLFVGIGVIFSFSIIYISSFIILSERNRELASMRVLGMTSQEVLSVITFEQWFLSFFALIASIPTAKLIQTGFASEWSTDMYTMPAEMSFQSLVMGVLITVLSIWVAQRFALRKVKKLDLVEVLKSRE
ncbi:putative ABC transport system permease protein [Desulfitispora alkaliphila]|uniref:ABC transporter permease n=1 Tax=Desulfitispora alkaliphila TaxID=622674 RepID=UPI003D22C9E7